MFFWDIYLRYTIFVYCEGNRNNELLILCNIINRSRKRKLIQRVYRRERGRKREIEIMRYEMINHEEEDKQILVLMI